MRNKKIEKRREWLKSNGFEYYKLDHAWIKNDVGYFAADLYSMSNEEFASIQELHAQIDEMNTDLQPKKEFK